MNKISVEDTVVLTAWSMLRVEQTRSEHEQFSSKLADMIQTLNNSIEQDLKDFEE